jgi:hypothetical protein
MAASHLTAVTNTASATPNTLAEVVEINRPAETAALRIRRLQHEARMLAREQVEMLARDFEALAQSAEEISTGGRARTGLAPGRRPAAEGPAAGHLDEPGRPGLGAVGVRHRRSGQPLSTAPCRVSLRLSSRPCRSSRPTAEVGRRPSRPDAGVASG